MEAVRLVAPRTFDRVTLAPRPVGPGEVRVEVAAVSICGSDLLGYLGQHPRIKPPTIIGHELAGTITEVGAGVEGLPVGTRVAVDPTSGCGTCRYCLTGRWNVCPEYIVLGEGEELPGGLSGNVVIRADRVFPLPDSVSFELGAIAQPLAVALHAVRDRARIQPGETMLILGGGPIGVGAMLAANALGGRAIVVDLVPERLAIARELGAWQTIDAGTEDVDARVLELTDGWGTDTAIEAVGAGQNALFAQAVRLTARGGRIVVVGLKASSIDFDLGTVKWMEKSVLGSQAHPHTFPEVIARLADGSLAGVGMITHRFDWEHVPDAFTLLESRADGILKVVLVR